MKGEVPSRKKDSEIRISPILSAKLLLNFLNQPADSINETYLYCDARFDFLPQEDETEHHYFETGINFPLNSNASIICSYLHGERAPLYLDEEKFSITLGVQF